jgi:hypothetical protein
MDPQVWQAAAAMIGALAVFVGVCYAIRRDLLAQLKSIGPKAHVNDITGRLERIENKLDDHSQRITRVEERTSPLHR